jgi:integrase
LSATETLHGKPAFSSEETIHLRRSDFIRLHDYVLHHGPLRDFCLFRVPMKCGLRPGEIATLRWEGVDFDALTLNIIDSKNHKPFPIPMDILTADYLREFRADRVEGLVIQRDPNCRVWRHLVDQRLSKENLEYIIKKWSKLAGLQNWRSMRMYDLRHYFAANWAYPADGKRPGNLHALSKILRHKTLLCTQIYLSRLVFYEDLQAEYDRLQKGPLSSTRTSEMPTCGNWFFDKYCRVCEHQPACRFIDQAMSSEWAISCKFFSPKAQALVPGVS